MLSKFSRKKRSLLHNNLNSLTYHEESKKKKLIKNGDKIKIKNLGCCPILTPIYLKKSIKSIQNLLVLHINIQYMNNVRKYQICTSFSGLFWRECKCILFLLTRKVIRIPHKNILVRWPKNWKVNQADLSIKHQQVVWSHQV